MTHEIEPPKQEPAATLVSAVSNVAALLVTALPPAFLVLVLLNIGFLGVVLWFVENLQEQRTALLKDLLNTCYRIMEKQ